MEAKAENLKGLNKEEFKKLYKEQIDKYQKKGASFFKKNLSDMIRFALTQRISPSYVWFVAGICMDLDYYDKAIELLKAIQKPYKNCDVYYNNLGVCYWELERYQEACEAYKKSLKLNPKNELSIKGLAFCSIENNDPNMLRYNKSFYQISKKSEKAAMWYAIALYNLDKIKELKNFFKQRQKEVGIEKQFQDWEEYKS